MVTLTDQENGAVLLGSEVSCDGYSPKHFLRVQTHWHTDHMRRFSTSKGRSEIVLTQQTLDLLASDPNHSDLPERYNVHVCEIGRDSEIEGIKIRLEGSDHCLGGVQVAAELEDKTRVGYSGDFSWPVHPIHVDVLVLDATYGSPENIRPYTQDDAETALLELVRGEILNGRAVHLIAKGGVTERALSVLHGDGVIEDIPVLGASKLFRSHQVHINHGYPLPPIENEASTAGQQAMASGRYIRCWGAGSGSRHPNDTLPGTRISLTKFRNNTEVVRESGINGYSVGFSNHADHDETLEYVRATGAEFVLTDGTRSRSAGQLANIIQETCDSVRKANAFTLTPTQDGVL